MKIHQDKIHSLLLVIKRFLIGNIFWGLTFNLYCPISVKWFSSEISRYEFVLGWPPGEWIGNMMMMANKHARSDFYEISCFFDFCIIKYPSYSSICWNLSQLQDIKHIFLHFSFITSICSCLFLYHPAITVLGWNTNHLSH